MSKKREHVLHLYARISFITKICRNMFHPFSICGIVKEEELTKKANFPTYITVLSLVLLESHILCQMFVLRFSVSF